MKKPFTFSWIDSQEQRIGKRRKESGQQDQEQADAVDAEVVMNRLADPGVEFLELVVGVRRSRSRAAGASEIDEFGKRRGERDAANPDVVVRAQQQQSRHARAAAGT